MALSSLPAVGWTAHSEQVDLASLEARVWMMSTKLVAGEVCTMLLPEVRPGEIAKLERLAQHALSCTNPGCHIKHGVSASLCPNGKYDPAMQVFFTTARTLDGHQLMELCAVATEPKFARQNHYAACAMLVGVTAHWTRPTVEPV